MTMLLFLAIFFVFFAASGHAAPSTKKIDNNSKIVGDGNEDLRVLIEEAVDWAHHIGFISRRTEQRERSDVAEFIAFTLFPSPFPRKYYEQAVNLQKSMQLLQFRIACDYEFLVEVHRQVVDSDGFIRNAIGLIQQMKKEGIKQPITLITFRSDYMLNVVGDDGDNSAPKYALKQIEVNTGAVGGNDKSRRIGDIHRRTLSRAGMDAASEVLPTSLADIGLAEALYLAWQKFDNPRALMLIMVYGPNNKHQFGQRSIEYEVERISEGRVKIVRLTVAECIQRLRLAKDFSLRLDGRVVGLIYNRTSPDTYFWSKWAWRTFCQMERSTAIKASTLFAQLSSTKKVQQVLALPGMVERFFPDPEDAPTVAAIRETYAGLWGLENDNEATKSLIQDAVAHPDRYVLKPQREGGGNNFFDEQIVEKLSSFSPQEKAAHILMERLRPMVVKNYMIRPMQEAEFGDVVGELGVFGVLLGNMREKRVLHNVQHGAYVRTKWEHVTEGGISAGGGVIDSPYLY